MFLKLPKIVQGGMGVNISGWRLAKKVSMLGQLGTVSGVIYERVFARMLQMGDPGGHLRRALSHFPFQEHAERVIQAFYVEGGKPENVAFKTVPVFTLDPLPLLKSLTICANFALVWLVKEGHDNSVSINWLEKVAPSHVYAITGAMLAGVNVITMGAGIPFQIPGVIDAILEGGTVSYNVPVEGVNIKRCTVDFDPAKFLGGKLPPMKRPEFLPIIASNLLAGILMKRLPGKGRIGGFVIEEQTAGGHNAPPRKGDAYGPKDEVDYPKIKSLGLPFWIGGSKASPEKLKWALSVGASGIQVGSAFALCEESGMEPGNRAKIRKLGFQGKLTIRTDFALSPAWFPFKVAELDGTLSQPEVYEARDRERKCCDHGALATLYERPDGSIGIRCPAEPVGTYVAKGGNEADTVGKVCLCKALLSAAGIGNPGEPSVVTLGDDVSFLPHLMADVSSSFRAEDVINYLLGQPPVS